MFPRTTIEDLSVSRLMIGTNWMLGYSHTSKAKDRDIVETIPNDMIQDILDYHSGVVEAAQTAARVGAARLALTHMVPAPTADQYPEWVARAAEHYDGEIIIGDDLTTVSV